MNDIVFGVSSASCLLSQRAAQRSAAKDSAAQHTTGEGRTDDVQRRQQRRYVASSQQKPLEANVTTSSAPKFRLRSPQFSAVPAPATPAPAEAVLSCSVHKRVREAHVTSSSSNKKTDIPLLVGNSSLRQELGRGPPVGVHHHRLPGPNAPASPSRPRTPPSQPNTDCFLVFHQDLEKPRSHDTTDGRAITNR